MRLTRIIIIGTGPLGQELAQWFAQQMCCVELVDASSDDLIRALNAIHENWDKLVREGVLDAGQVGQMRKLLVGGPLEYVGTNPDLVIDTYEGDPGVKKNHFSNLDYIFSSPTIFATPVASLSVTDLAESISEERKTRLVGLQFLDPIALNGPVKVVKGEATEDKLYRELGLWFEIRGKRIVC